MNALIPWLTPIVVALLGGGGIWAWLASKPTGQAAITAAQATFATALNQQSAAFIVSLQNLLVANAKTIAELTARVDQLDEDNEKCHGENRQLRALLDAFRRELIAHGVDLPAEPPVASLLEFEFEGVTVMGAKRGRTVPKP